MTARFIVEGQARSWLFDSHGRRILPTTRLIIPESLPIFFEHIGAREGDEERMIGYVRTVTRQFDGLHMRGVLKLDDGSQFKADILRKLEAGSVKSLSIGYLPGIADLDNLSKPQATLSEIELLEVSVCSRNGADPLGKIEYLGRIS